MTDVLGEELVEQINNRPIEVVAHAMMSTAELLNIAGTLATTDATIITEVTDQAHVDFIGEFALAVAKNDGMVPKDKIRKLSSYNRFIDLWSSLHATMYPHRSMALPGGKTTAGLKYTFAQFFRSDAPVNTVQRHSDSSTEGMLSSTYNITLATPVDGWEWLLTDETGVHQASIPLQAGGVAILGECARIDSNGLFQTVHHEVVPPAEALSEEGPIKAALVVF